MVSCIAASGGVIILWGLIWEEYEEKDWFQNITKFRMGHSKAIWGRKIVLFGIVVEIVVGFGVAIYDAWQIGETRIEQVQMQTSLTNLPQNMVKAEEAQYNGELLPANDPFPNGWNPPTNSVTLYLGNSASLILSVPHFVIFSLSEGKPILSVSTNSFGFTVSADFFDKNGTIVATLKDNVFHINKLNSFMIERPDKSTLRVRDQQNTTILDVRFLNPWAIKLNGDLYLQNGKEILIDDHAGFFSQHVFFMSGLADLVE